MTVANHQLEDHSGLLNNFFLNAPPYEPAWFYTTVGLTNELADVAAGTQAIPGGTGATLLQTQECCAYSSIGIRLIRGATAGTSPAVTGRIVGLSPFGNKIISSFEIKSARPVDTIGAETVGGGSIVATDKVFARVDRIIFDTVSANNADRLEIGYVNQYLPPYTLTSPSFSIRGGLTGTDYGTDGYIVGIPHAPGEWEREGLPGVQLVLDMTDANADQFNDGDLIIIGDEQRSLVFELDSNSAITAGNILVTIGANARATRDNLIAAINAQGSWFVAEADTISSADLGALLIYGGGEKFIVESFRPATGQVPNTEANDWFTGDETQRRIFVIVSAQGIPAAVAWGAIDGDLIEINDGFGGSETFEFESAGGVDSGNTSVAIGVTPPTSTATNLAAAINTAAFTGIAPTVDVFAQDDGGLTGAVRIMNASPNMTVKIYSANTNLKFYWEKVGKPRLLGGPLEGSFMSLEMHKVCSVTAGTGVRDSNLKPAQAGLIEFARIKELPFGLLAEVAGEIPAIDAVQDHMCDNQAAAEPSDVYHAGQTLGYFGILRPRRHPSAQYVNHERVVSPGRKYLLGKRFGGDQVHVEPGATAGRVNWEAPSQDEGHLWQ